MATFEGSDWFAAKEAAAEAGYILAPGSSFDKVGDYWRAALVKVS